MFVAVGLCEGVSDTVGGMLRGAGPDQYWGCSK
jgi:hypothetical protein